jgi:DNA-binding MarR family transcriptional regulator
MGHQESPEDRWDHTLVHLLGTVSTRTLILGEAALEDTPLTLAGMGVLKDVKRQPGITIAEISRIAPKTQQAISQIASRLEKLGYVDRRLVPGERGIGLYLTDAGSVALKAALEDALASDASLAAALGPRRYQRLVALLEEAESVTRELKPERRRNA